MLGLLFSLLANNDGLHRLLRKMRITRETSFPSEWFGAFQRKPGEAPAFLVLHFKDGQRLRGWPTEQPTDPEKGHFVLANPAWVDADTGEGKPIPGVRKMLVAADDVQWVEFLEQSGEN